MSNERALYCTAGVFMWFSNFVNFERSQTESCPLTCNALQSALPAASWTLRACRCKCGLREWNPNSWVGMSAEKHVACAMAMD